MHILILNWRDPQHPLAGGAEQSLLQHAKYWQKRGATVTWFASHFSKGKKKETLDGITYIRSGSHYTVHLHAFWAYVKKQILHPDVVIDCFHFVPYFSPLYIRKSKILALINEPAKNAWFKNIYFPLNIIGYLLEPLFFLPYRRSLFFTGSQSIAAELPQYGVNPHAIRVVHHGVTTLPVKKVEKEEQPTIIYVAQLSPDKGIEDAIYAFQEVLQEYPKAKLWVVGRPIDDGYLHKIKEIVSKLSIANNVTFFGYVSQQEKFTLLAKAWILVHPSIREGWGLNVIEANSVGTPAIGYDVVGLRDSIRNNETGLLCAPNRKALGEMIKKLLKDKRLSQQLSSHAVEWARNFSWEESGKKSWKIITEA